MARRKCGPRLRCVTYHTRRKLQKQTLSVITVIFIIIVIIIIILFAQFFHVELDKPVPRTKLRSPIKRPKPSVLQAGCPSCRPTDSVRARKEKVSHSMDLITPSSPGGLPTLTTWASWFPWRGIPSPSSGLWLQYPSRSAIWQWQLKAITINTNIAILSLISNFSLVYILLFFRCWFTAYCDRRI